MVRIFLVLWFGNVWFGWGQLFPSLPLEKGGTQGEWKASPQFDQFPWPHQMAESPRTHNSQSIALERLVTCGHLRGLLLFTAMGGATPARQYTAQIRTQFPPLLRVTLWGRTRLTENAVCSNWVTPMNIFLHKSHFLTILSLSLNGCICWSTVPCLNNEETAQIILGHSIHHRAKSLSKCSFHKTSHINCFYIHRFNLLFSEDEICFKLPNLFRFRVSLNCSVSFLIRLLYRHCSLQISHKTWIASRYLLRCNLSKGSGITVHPGKGWLHMIKAFSSFWEGNSVGCEGEQGRQENDSAGKTERKWGRRAELVLGELCWLRSWYCQRWSWRKIIIQAQGEGLEAVCNSRALNSGPTWTQVGWEGEFRSLASAHESGVSSIADFHVKHGPRVPFCDSFFLRDSMNLYLCWKCHNFYMLANRKYLLAGPRPQCPPWLIIICLFAQNICRLLDISN
jgi:hypothetical protein